MFAKTNCLKNEKLYIFEKPLTMPFQICKNFGKILNNLYYRRNLTIKILRFFKPCLVIFIFPTCKNIEETTFEANLQQLLSQTLVRYFPCLQESRLRRSKREEQKTDL